MGERQVGWVPRWAARLAAAVIGVALLLLVVLAAFPWGILVGSNIRPLAAALGRPVLVGSARRVDRFGLVPTIELTDVRIGKPAWQGTGDMARIAAVRITLPVVPLLFGRLRPHAIDLRGVRLALFRDAQGRANWASGRTGDKPTPPHLAHLTIADGRFHLTDLGRDVVLGGTLASDDTHGLAVTGTGTLRRTPLTVTATGAALGAADPAMPYPLRLVVRSALVRLAARAVLDRPLYLAGFSAHVVTAGRDLTYFDDLVQAGLFPTRAFDLAGDVRRDGDRWRITGLAGTIGRSAVTASVNVGRRDGRTRIAGTLVAQRFDFDDFTSAAQRARGAARLAAIGPHLLPETPIDLRKLARLDGVLRFRAARLLTGAGSPFRSLATTVTLDHRRLTLDPLDVGLVAGRMTGRITVDDRGVTPVLSVDTHIAGSTIEGLVIHSGAIRGPMRARALLTGRGATFRAAMGDAAGRIGVYVPSGSVRRDYATFVGGDVVGSVGAAIGGDGDRVALRCLVGTLRATGGRLVPDPLVIDTAASRADAAGAIDLASERIDLGFTGRSKQPTLIQSTAPTRVFGTLTHPQVDIRPPRAADTGRTGTLQRIGFFLKGLRVKGDKPRDAPAPDADCAGLGRAALR